MISTNSRLSLLALAIYLTSAVAAKPYAPELSSLSERTVVASRPVADSVFARSSEEDPIQIKRAEASWSALNILGARSEEEMHARGQVEDSIIEKRGKCWADSECGSGKYCSTKKNKCYNLIKKGHGCSKNKACESGYCSTTSNTCQYKKSNGAFCKGNNSACKSGYCSVKTELCRAKAGKGGSCIVDQGCSWPYTCDSHKKCEKGHGSTPSPTGPSNPGPSNPSPSGSAKSKRELKAI